MQPSPVIRFGVFELDSQAGELRKHGLKIKLQDQPFQILVMLLEQPGQVVTREQLHKKLWSDGTVIDFEHGLNAAIQRLRQALGDSAENPRFVETLARRGYRFLAPVEEVRGIQENNGVPTADGREPHVAVALAAITLGAGCHSFVRSCISGHCLLSQATARNASRPVSDSAAGTGDVRLV